jgi:hypothetical protein
MKVIIAGSRDIYQECTDQAGMQAPFTPTEIVSGGARGPDSHGEVIAKANNIPVKQFIPDWHKYGKGAGFRRNAAMAEYADALIAVWDGKSKGTAHMIKTMEALGKPVYVYKTE